MAKNNTGKAGERTRAAILEAGLALMRIGEPITMRAVGRMVNRTHQCIGFHYRTTIGLRDAIAAHALAVGDAIVVPMLITAHHPAILGLTDAERAKYLSGC